MADFVKNYFAAVDTMNAEDVASYFTEDARFKFGNAEPAVGRQNIRDALVAFYNSIKGLHHDIREQWQQDGVAIVVLDVTYTRTDNKTVTLPSATILRTSGNLIRELQIYMDISPVFA